MSDDLLHLVPEPPLGFLVLNRPDHRNAINKAMWKALPKLLQEAADDSEIKVLILRGTDGSAFCSGADIEEFPEIYGDEKKANAYAKLIADGLAAMADFPKPAIAMVQGPCVGGGFGLAVACDLRFADGTARFALTPAKLGLAYNLTETRRLVQLVGPAMAKDILFSGRILKSEEAQRIGLIERIVDGGRLLQATTNYAKAVAENSQTSTRASKAMIRMILDGAVEETKDSKALYTESFQGEDFKEGAQAFLDKRKPDFPVA